MILLDTCTLLWLVGDQERLSPRARDRLREHAGELFVSAISAFEIGIKHRKGKLALPLEPGPWFEEAMDFHGLAEIPVSARIAAHSTTLPALHSDPCDRIIVATAQLLGLTVLTPDALIRAYADSDVEW
jgi:PIN domain nuclease of toxin-antitoxin system